MQENHKNNREKVNTNKEHLVILIKVKDLIYLNYEKANDLLIDL